MKPITKYQSDSGEVWNTAEDASAADAVGLLMAQFIAPLGPEADDEGCKFANGGGYIQHDPEVVVAARAEIVKFLRLGPLKWVFKGHEEVRDEEWQTGSILGRCIDDSHNLPRAVKDAWYRLHRIDEKGREWGQPYFTFHPEKAEQKEWTRRKAS